METTKNGFIKRKKDTGVEIAAWIFAIGFLTCIVFGVLWIRKYKQTPKTIPQTNIATTPIVKDSIYYADSIILSKLIDPLKKREGLSLKPYYDGKYYYKGYGHLITPNDTFVSLTEESALELLKNDIRGAYWEVMRIHRKTLYDDVFSVFISGRMGVKDK